MGTQYVLRGAFYRMTPSQRSATMTASTLYVLGILKGADEKGICLNPEDSTKGLKVERLWYMERGDFLIPSANGYGPSKGYPVQIDFEEFSRIERPGLIEKDENGTLRGAGSLDDALAINQGLEQDYQRDGE